MSIINQEEIVFRGDWWLLSEQPESLPGDHAPGSLQLLGRLVSVFYEQDLFGGQSKEQVSLFPFMNHLTHCYADPDPTCTQGGMPPAHNHSVLCTDRLH